MQFLTAENKFVTFFLAPAMYKSDTPERYLIAACLQSHDISTGIPLTNLALYFPGSAPSEQMFRTNIPAIKAAVQEQIRIQAAKIHGNYTIQADPTQNNLLSANLGGLVLLECAWWEPNCPNTYLSPPDLLHFENHGYVAHG